MTEECVLVINLTDSYCASCNQGCDPTQKTHDVILGWAPGDRRPGCGRRFTHLRSDYVGLRDAVEAMRPDLEWVGFET